MHAKFTQAAVVSIIVNFPSEVIARKRRPTRRRIFPDRPRRRPPLTTHATYTPNNPSYYYFYFVPGVPGDETERVVNQNFSPARFVVSQIANLYYCAVYRFHLLLPLHSPAPSDFTHFIGRTRVHPGFSWISLKRVCFSKSVEEKKSGRNRSIAVNGDNNSFRY